MGEQLIGTVSHYFSKAQVAALEITAGELAVGDTVRIVGTTTDFTQSVDSMQVEHDQVESVSAGAQVGIRVSQKARQNDRVYRVVPD
jgi:translation initiation factor IF-2